MKMGRPHRVPLSRPAVAVLHTMLEISGGDPNILSKIGSIKIGGAVLGTPSSVNSSDSFGFEAEQIGSVSIGGVVLPLQAGAHNDNFLLGVTTDFRLREL